MFYFLSPFFLTSLHSFLLPFILFLLSFTILFLVPFRFFFTSLQTFFTSLRRFLLSFRLFYFPSARFLYFSSAFPPPSVFLLPFSIFKSFFEIFLKEHQNSLLSVSRECEQGWNRSGTLLQNSEIVLMWVVLKERFIIFCFSKSCLHSLSVAFYVLAIIVVLYYIIARYSSLSGSHAEDISTEETPEGCSSSPRMFLNTNLLLNDENIVRDKFIIY